MMPGRVSDFWGFEPPILAVVPDVSAKNHTLRKQTRFNRMQFKSKAKSQYQKLIRSNSKGRDRNFLWIYRDQVSAEDRILFMVN